MVILYGAGGFSAQVVEAFELNQCKIDGFYDDQCQASSHLGYPILTIYGTEPKFCCIGNPQVRQKFNHSINCIDPDSRISTRATLGVGNYIGPGVKIMPGAIIGDGNIVDCGAVISHDCRVGDNNLIASNAVLLGGVVVGSRNIIGANSTIQPRLTLQNDNRIGAGAVITKNFGSELTLIGIPARASAEPREPNELFVPLIPFESRDVPMDRLADCIPSS